MLPALQPSRPKHPQQTSRPTYAQIQTRSTHEQPPVSSPFHPKQSLSPSPNLMAVRPRNQVEAMPPFVLPQTSLLPPRNLYNSAVRHPVFFTEQLRKPPFPIPEMASCGFSPVARGYIMETRKMDATGIPKTKL